MLEEPEPFPNTTETTTYMRGKRRARWRVSTLITSNGLAILWKRYFIGVVPATLPDQNYWGV